jgi:hypothetical protein
MESPNFSLGMTLSYGPYTSLSRLDPHYELWVKNLQIEMWSRN